jgi:phage terminase large subunit-like protein
VVDRAGSTRRVERAIDYWSPTQIGLRWFRDETPVALWRDANQVGKSSHAAYYLIQFCRGQAPYWRFRYRPPVHALVLSISHEQMEPLHRRIWELLPKDEIDPRNGFEPGRGITGKPPRIVFTSGPGAGSVISFATYKAGAQRIAGFTGHLLILDEPPTERIYGEATPRLFRHGGQMRICMTLTPDSPPQEWLQKKVEAGEVSETNNGLDLKAVTPIGSHPWLSQQRIDRFIASLLPHEAPLRLGRSWEPLLTDRVLTNYGPWCVDATPPPAGSRLAVGVDHGTQAGKQRAMLVGLHQRGKQDVPGVWWWDESGSDGETTPDQDADAILEMLRRNGLNYDDVDEWTGDRETGENKYAVKKTNADLRRALARKLKRPLEQTKPIYNPSKWEGSVDYGFRLMNSAFGYERDRQIVGLRNATVHPRCVMFRQACERWRGGRKEKHKDPLDAGRYAMERLVKDLGDFSGFRAIYN